jgi:hypothetical protein
MAPVAPQAFQDAQFLLAAMRGTKHQSAHAHRVHA